MFCNKCGKPIGDDQLLCEQCQSAGKDDAPVAADTIPDEVTPVPGGSVSIDRAKIVKPLAIGVMAVVVILTVVLLWKPVSALFGSSLKFDTPQEHFAYVEGKSAAKLTDNITGTYGSILAHNEKTEYAYETEVHILTGEDLLELTEAYFGEDEEIDLSWLSDIMLKADVTSNTEIGQAVLSLGLGEKEVISADVIYDLSSMLLWAAVPELSSTYLESDLRALMNTDKAPYDSEYISGFIKALPSEQIVNELLKKYSDIMISGITNVESKTETVSVGDLSQSCTALVATVDERALLEIMIAVLEEAQDDALLVQALEGLADFAGADQAVSFVDEWKQVIGASIEDVRSALETADSGNYVQLTDYVDSKHNIIGRHILVTGVEEEIFYLNVTDGDKFVFEADILDTISLSCTGTNVYYVLNGECSLCLENEELAKIQLVDVDLKKLYSKNLKGTIRLIPSEALMEEITGDDRGPDIALELILDTKKDQASAEVYVLLNDARFLGITAQLRQTDATVVKIPTNTIDSGDETELVEWMAGFDYDTVVDRLGKAGVPEEVLDAVEQLAEIIEENSDA